MVTSCSRDHRSSWGQQLIISKRQQSTSDKIQSSHCNTITATSIMTSRFSLSAARLTGRTVQVDKEENKATVTIPNLGGDFVDRNGAMDPLAVQRLISGARFLAYHIPPKGETKAFLEYDEMTKEIFTFMASTRTEVTPAFYEIPEAVETPSFGVDVKLGYVGNSSLSSVSEFKDLKSGTVFARNINQVVTVSKTTRKPTAIPQWWKEKYFSYGGGDSFKLKIPQMQKPEKCFDYKIKVRWSDTDAYRHVNYITYVRFCKDAATDAVDQGFCSRLAGDLLNYSLTSMQMMYKGESLPNQELLVSLWEDSENPYTLHFDISREGTTIFQSSIEFKQPATS